MADNKKIEYTISLRDLFSKGMADMAKQVENLDAKMSKASEGSMTKSVLAANMISNATGWAISKTKEFAAESVKSYMKMEMYESRMTTLLHNREQALSAIQGIVKDAAKTPFDLQSLIQGNSMLIGSGESALGARQSIMDLGNAIAATGGGSDELNRMSVNLAQIKSIGKASALDVKQFMFANIPIYEMLSKSMHKNVNEIKSMDISYKDLTKALSDARKEGGMFYQGLENANKTLTGQVSNLGDAWDQLKTSIGRSQSGILKDTVSWANDMVTAMNDSFRNSEFVSNAITKRGGNIQSHSGGSDQTRENLYALSGMAQNSIGRASDATSSAKEKAFLINLMKVKKDQFAAETKGMTSSIDVGLRATKFQNEMAVLQEGLAQIKEGSKARSMADMKEKEGAKAEKLLKGGSSLGSSTDVYGARPQNLTINITKLIENFTISTTNMSESTQKIKENVSKALLEAVNDVNQVVK